MRNRRYKRVCKLINITILLLILSLGTLVLVTACGSSDDGGKEIPDTAPSTEADNDISDVIVTIPPLVELPETPTTEPSDELEDAEPIWEPSKEDIEALAKTLWGECRGVKSKAQQAAVAWCVLNRLDKGTWGDTVLSVVSAPYQFSGYSDSFPVTDELADLARDVMIRWHSEKEGIQDVGRVLPKDYIFFVGDGKLNYFTNEWKSTNYWDWSLPNPYES